jgi:hypothetical protein
MTRSGGVRVAAKRLEVFLDHFMARPSRGEPMTDTFSTFRQQGLDESREVSTGLE